MLKRIESFFVLSPVLWAWAMLFNVPDSKHVLSRLIVLVSIYCIVRFRGDIINKLEDDSIKLFILSLLIAASYYSYLHFFRGGHFDFPRVLFTLSLYFISVPKRFFIKEHLIFFIFFSSLVFFVMAIYQYYILSIYRVGFIVNAGPYAFVVGLLILTSTLLLFEESNSKMKLILLASVAMLSFCLINSQTRAIWLSLTIALITLMVSNVIVSKHTIKNSIYCILFIVFMTWGVSQNNTVDNRVNRLKNEVSAMLSGNLNSSSGTRLDMWLHGLEFFKESPIIGVSYNQEMKLVNQSYSNQNMTNFSYRILYHKKPSYHNVFIQALVKGGIVGVTLIFLICLSPLFNNFGKNKKIVSLVLVQFTIVSFMFESHLTIYNQVAYFMLLLNGYLILFTPKPLAE